MSVDPSRLDELDRYLDDRLAPVQVADAGNLTGLLSSPAAAQQTIQKAMPPRRPDTSELDRMRPNLLWIDPTFTPKQPAGNLLMPFWPTADNVTDWLGSGPPGSPQASDDPAFQRRLEGTRPLPGVRYETPQETENRLLSNAPWLGDLGRWVGSIFR